MRIFRLRTPALHLTWGQAITGALLEALGRLLGWAVRAAWRHPVTSAALAGVAGLGWVWWRLGGALTASAVVLAGAGVWLAAWLWPAGWARWAVGPVRARWRRTQVYGKTWDRDMVALKLDRGDYLPGLEKVTPGEDRDVLRVLLAPGSIPDDWDEARLRLASTWGARTVRVRRTADPRRIDVHVRYAGPIDTGGTAESDDQQTEAFPL